MNNRKTPKYKIGEKVLANWAGGHMTKHIITGIENTERGFWYSWKSNVKDNHGSGLHEHHLNKVYN